MLYTRNPSNHFSKRSENYIKIKISSPVAYKDYLLRSIRNETAFANGTNDDTLETDYILPRSESTLEYKMAVLVRIESDL